MYQLGKYINTIQDFVVDNNKTADLFLLGGDLNTSSDEFAFKLLG